MNLKALAARFVELHPQYKYDLTNHAWVIADPSADGGYLYPTSDRLIGDEVQALTVAMVDANNADNRARRERPFQYLHSEFFKPLRAACRVRLPVRHIPWDDADQLAKLPGWKSQVTFLRGKMYGCWDTHLGMPWIEVNVMQDAFNGSGWRAFACGVAINGNRPEGQSGVCRLDALRRLLDLAPWLRQGLAGPAVAKVEGGAS
jgi:hypothetical protein